jgi:hypothetical protein
MIPRLDPATLQLVGEIIDRGWYRCDMHMSSDGWAALYQHTDWRWPAYTARFEDDSTFDLRARDEQAALSGFAKLFIPPYTVSRREVIYIPVMEVNGE